MKLKKTNLKIGIMGGSFNPPHFGHINSILTVKEKLKLDKIIIVPTFRLPFKDSSLSTSASHRLNMVEIFFKDYDFITIDEQEIKRKGTSYSYRTVEALDKKFSSHELFFIIGLDQFQTFDTWKNVFRLLEKTHLIVTSRVHFLFPKIKKEFPIIMKPIIKNWSSQQASLTTGNQLYFCPLKDIDVSSSLIRKCTEQGKNIKKYLPQNVKNYILKNNLYQNSQEEKNVKTSTRSKLHSQSENFSKKLSLFCAEELKNNKASDIKIFDLSSHASPFLFGLIASSSNIRHSKALAQNLQKKIKQVFKINSFGKEGESEGHWIALDYEDIIIHIFSDYTRGIYQFEDIWKEASLIKSL